MGGLMGYLLDTSALLAHYRNEPGADRVQEILESAEAEIYISSLSIAEFARSMKNLGMDTAAARTAALEYTGLCDKVINIDTAAAVRAYEIAAECETRLPLIDALIASCASTTETILVHKDPHFDAIPEGLMQSPVPLSVSGTGTGQ